MVLYYVYWPVIFTGSMKYFYQYYKANSLISTFPALSIFTTTYMILLLFHSFLTGYCDVCTKHNLGKLISIILLLVNSCEFERCHLWWKSNVILCVFSQRMKVATTLMCGFSSWFTCAVNGCLHVAYILELLIN